MTILFDNDRTAALGLDSQFSGEESRFRSILQRHVNARGALRRELRNVLVEYLKFSPNRSALINDPIFASPLRSRRSVYQGTGGRSPTTEINAEID